MPQRVLDLLTTWQGSFGRHQNIAFWRVVLHCIMCVLGKNRMLEALRDVNGLFLRLNPFSFILC